ncbi:MAG: cob(I)yrinic acid a,c-diamide adenosyltransferase [Acidobacteriota bacterium]|nr:MAG: cob(I)yrinic acid a,c-diamide adenosyltransferase [Acidobacteriota bacterium]
MTKIYTRAGDDGETGLIGGERVPKSHLRIAAYGGVDEANAALGTALALLEDSGLKALLEPVQHDLFRVGAALATPPQRHKTAPPLARADVQRLEQAIDRLEAELPSLREFILPGGSPAAANLHLARSIVRRAERSAVALSQREKVPPEILAYLNRLSDLLFVAARAANRLASVEDISWKK